MQSIFTRQCSLTSKQGIGFVIALKVSFLVNDRNGIYFCSVDYTSL